MWSEIPREYPPWAGGKKTAFWDRVWTFTKHISATEHDINNRKETCQSAGTSLHAPSPYLMNVGPEMAENGWWVFAQTLDFRIGRHCQPYRMDVI